MKPPKEPKVWRWPRLYWTEDPEQVDLIIIYPDGRYADRYAERTYSGMNNSVFMERTFFIPCWFILGPTMTPNQQRRAMMKYAKDNGFERIFIGEIK